MYIHDTICAIATSYGEGGIAIIRISGDDSFSIVGKIFFPDNPNEIKIENFKSFTLHHGSIKQPEGSIIDEVLLGIFRNPNSYTGEDVLEINCHGGRIVTKKILEILIQSGARLANPGEFTKRAFLNGKIDLSQAEAIADLISAKSDISLKYSLNLLKGEFGKILKGYQKDLLDICSLIELELDFAEEDLQFAERKEVLEKIQSLNNEIHKMIDSYNVGRLFKDGVKVSIVGKPNAGKSTILNALLCSERAIVSDIPGTTRDFIEECLYEKGFLFRLTDTAGLRFSSDQIEQIGIERTKEQMKLSDIILYLFDLTQEYDASDWEFFKEILDDVESRDGFSKFLMIFNKCDLFNEDIITRFIENNNLILKSDSCEYLFISSKNSENIQKLKDRLVGLVTFSKINYDDTRVVTNFRHRESLIKTYDNLKNATESINRNESGEFIAIHLRAALNAIGEIVGTTTTEDILNAIFSRFCIGK
jgi:tRNA modification GTPase